MNIKKTVLYLLFSAFILILIYNFALPLLSTQYTSQMGMHMRYYNNYNYYGNVISIFIYTLVILAAIVILKKIFPANGLKKCKKCGLVIESEEWKICPRCGTSLIDGSVK